jgi:hypothetical protein
MEQFFRFIRQSERERNRIAQEAGAIYDSVFQAAPGGDQSNKASVGHTISGVSAFRNDGVFS